MTDVKWPCTQEEEASFKIGHAQKDPAAERPRESVALSDGRTSESTIRMSDELMALPADKHANHCYDSASSHPGVCWTLHKRPCMPLWLQRQCSAIPASRSIPAPGVTVLRNSCTCCNFCDCQASHEAPVIETPCHSGGHADAHVCLEGGSHAGIGWKV